MPRPTHRDASYYVTGKSQRNWSRRAAHTKAREQARKEEPCAAYSSSVFVHRLCANNCSHQQQHRAARLLCADLETRLCEQALAVAVATALAAVRLAEGLKMACSGDSRLAVRRAQLAEWVRANRSSRGRATRLVQRQTCAARERPICFVSALLGSALQRRESALLSPLARAPKAAFVGRWTRVYLCVCSLAPGNRRKQVSMLSNSNTAQSRRKSARCEYIIRQLDAKQVPKALR